MRKSLKTCSRCVWAGLLIAFIMGCGGTSSTSAGGISADKYYRDASDQFPDPFLGQSRAPLESLPPSTLSPEKYSREASDRFPDALIGQQGAPLESSPSSTLTPDKYYRDASDQFPDPFLGQGR